MLTLHAVVLRDTMREVGLDKPSRFASRFHQRTAEVVEPWYRATLAGDRDRLAEVDAGIHGLPYQPQGVDYQGVKAVQAAAAFDPDCLRAALDIRSVLKLPAEIFRADPALPEKAADLAAAAEEPPGPDREQLLAMVNA